MVRVFRVALDFLETGVAGVCCNLLHSPSGLGISARRRFAESVKRTRRREPGLVSSFSEPLREAAAMKRLAARRREERELIARHGIKHRAQFGMDQKQKFFATVPQIARPRRCH